VAEVEAAAEAAAVVAEGHPNDTAGTRGESCAEQTSLSFLFAVAWLVYSRNEFFSIIPTTFYVQ
jgi:hypothetical protein